MSDPSTTTNPTSNNGSHPDHAAEELKSAVVAGAQDVKEGLASLGHDAVEQTRQGAESQLTSGKERAADGLRDVAKALRTASKQMRDDKNDALTGYIDSAASRVSDASDYLKDHSLSDLSTDVKSFARREPALFLGGALVLGLIGGRFLKSSSPEVSSGASSGRPQYGAPPSSLVSTPRAPMRSSYQGYGVQMPPEPARTSVVDTAPTSEKPKSSTGVA